MVASFDEHKMMVGCTMMKEKGYIQDLYILLHLSFTCDGCILLSLRKKTSSSLTGIDHRQKLLSTAIHVYSFLTAFYHAAKDAGKSFWEELCF